MDLLLIVESVDASQHIIKAVSGAGNRLLKLIGPDDEAVRYAESLRPDAIVIISDIIDGRVLNQMTAISSRRPAPMLVFTRDAQSASIGLAVKAGAAAYVVDCDNPGRLAPLLAVAKARFDEHQRLNRELSQTKNALRDRKLVEKAKGIIMETRELSEDQAYSAMRKLAMNKNKRMGEIAEQIIAASELLV